MCSISALKPPPCDNSFSLFLCCAATPFIQPFKALEKNKQWLEYDQQREAYVRGILARKFRLEEQLNEVNQSNSQQHKEDHSDGEPEGQWAVGSQH